MSIPVVNFAAIFNMTWGNILKGNKKDSLLCLHFLFLSSFYYKKWEFTSGWKEFWKISVCFHWSSLLYLKTTFHLNIKMHTHICIYII